MSEEQFQALYKNTKKEEIIKELYFKCKANYKLKNIIKEVRELVENGFFSYTIIKDGKRRTISNKELLEILDKVEVNK